MSRHSPRCRPDTLERDNHLNNVRISRGYTQKELAKAVGISQGTIAMLCSSIIGPLYQTGPRKYEVKPWVEKIAETLHVSVADLFPRDICDIARGFYTQYQIRDLLHSNRFNGNRKEELTIALNKVLSTLTPRERDILRLRYLEEMSLQEIGAWCSVGKERIRQVEARALRKLRHPSRGKILMPFFEED